MQDYEEYVEAGDTESLEEYRAQEQDDDDDACVRFDIVQLLDIMSTRAALNNEALVSLAKLVELGVVIDELPDLECSIYSETDATSLITSLQTIMGQPGIRSAIVSD